VGETIRVTSIGADGVNVVGGDVVINGQSVSQTLAAQDAAITTVEAESVARDDALGTRITQETTARTAQDAALLGRITGETAASVAADTAIGNRILQSCGQSTSTTVDCS